MKITEWYRIYHNYADDMIWHKTLRMIENAGCEYHHLIDTVGQLTGKDVVTGKDIAHP